jgi:hypothetical protein
VTYPLAVHSVAAKTHFPSANLERNPIPSRRWSESVVEVFSTKTLDFTRFQACELTVFFGKKKFAEARNAKTLGYFSFNEMAEFATV